MFDYWLVMAIIGGVFGGVCAAIASAKGRHIWGWFFLGFFVAFIGFGFLGIVPLIVICCIENVNDQKQYRYHQEIENRRLREMLRQERLKHETFREHAQRRLDAHDVQLGVDTKTVYQPQLDDAGPAGYLQAPLNGHPHAIGDPGALVPAQVMRVQPLHGMAAVPPPPVVWYYEAAGRSEGPVPLEAVRALISSGRLPMTTLVWSEDLTDWTPANQVPQFAATYRST